MAGGEMASIVSKVDETRKGPKVWLHVLRGELAEGDEVEVLHADSSSEHLRFVDVGRHPVTPDNVKKIGGDAFLYAGPFKQSGVAAGSYRVGDVVRTPSGPGIEVDPMSPLVMQVAAARAQGLNKAGPHITDGLAALHIQWVMERVASGPRGLLTTSSGYSWAGRVLEEYGLIEQADRSTLLAAALLEGYEPGPAMRGLATLGAAVVGAVSVDSPLLVKAISMSIEEGDQFSKSYRNSLRVTGEAKRIPLMDQGRAIALGWCRKCGDITSLDKKLKCEVCGKESESFRVVVPSDREVAERELRAAGPPPKRGLFG